MKNRDIYVTALHLIAQSTMSDENADYEERAPYILASFCCEVSEVDKLLRRALKLPNEKKFNEVILSLDEDFPLLERFSSVASKYLAAMLVIDEDNQLSDKLFAMYCEGISIIQNEIPAAMESIINKYF